MFIDDRDWWINRQFKKNKYLISKQSYSYARRRAAPTSLFFMETIIKSIVIYYLLHRMLLNDITNSFVITKYKNTKVYVS